MHIAGGCHHEDFEVDFWVEPRLSGCLSKLTSKLTFWSNLQRSFRRFRLGDSQKSATAVPLAWRMLLYLRRPSYPPVLPYDLTPYTDHLKGRKRASNLLRPQRLNNDLPSQK